MPRIRAIKPQFWLDEELGSVSLEARLVYIGLWNLCDDRGVFEYIPARIRVQLFPYDYAISNDNVANWLAELLHIGNIFPFSEGEKHFGYIPSFLKHQQIQHPSKHYFSLKIPPIIEGSLKAHESSINVGREEEEEKVQGKGRVGVEGKVEGGVGGTAATAALEQIVSTVEQNFQRATTGVREKLTAWFSEYGNEQLCFAVDEAIKYNKLNLAYVEAVLQGRNNGRQPRNKKEMDPDKFIQGKYGHMVQR